MKQPITRSQTSIELAAIESFETRHAGFQAQQSRLREELAAGCLAQIEAYATEIAHISKAAACESDERRVSSLNETKEQSVSKMEKLETIKLAIMNLATSDQGETGLFLGTKEAVEAGRH